MESPQKLNRFRHAISIVLDLILILIFLGPGVLASYKVVMKDGRTFEVRTRPVSMEGQYRFTSVDGKFWVFPLDQVDQKATEAANQAPTTALSPAKRYTNEDLAVAVSSTKTQEAPSVSSVQREGTERKAVADNAQLAERGRDESYWRKRAKVLRDQIAANDKQIENLNREIRDKKNEGIIYGMGTYTPYIVAGLNNLQDRLSALQKEKNRLQKEYSDLEEEARKAGALPGWLR